MINNVAGMLRTDYMELIPRAVREIDLPEDLVIINVWKGSGDLVNVSYHFQQPRTRRWQLTVTLAGDEPPVGVVTCLGGWGRWIVWKLD